MRIIIYRYKNIFQHHGDLLRDHLVARNKKVAVIVQREIDFLMEI